MAFGEGLEAEDFQFITPMACNACNGFHDPNNAGNYFWYGNGTSFNFEEEEDEPGLTLEESVKEFLTELLHSDDLSAESVEKLSLFKAAFELLEDEMSVTKKRIALAEQVLRRRL